MKVTVIFQATVRGLYTFEVGAGQKFIPDNVDTTMERVIAGLINAEPPREGTMDKITIEVERAVVTEVWT